MFSHEVLLNENCAYDKESLAVTIIECDILRYYERTK